MITARNAQASWVLRLARVTLVMIMASLATLAVADETKKAQPSGLGIDLVYLAKAYPEPPPLSLIEPIIDDEGLQGARLGHKENGNTGRLLGQTYTLSEVIVPEDKDAVAAARDLLNQGRRLIVADLHRDDLLAIAALPAARDAIIFNIRDSDDRLRQEDCRKNLFHVIPSFAQRADALAQYLVWKRWPRWFLITGKQPADLAYAAAIRRASARFGGTIVEERTYAFEAGSRRIESGHQQIQTQMPQLTQGAPEHDVVLVTDAAEAFGEYLLFRTAMPRPVVGTHGLIAVAWHRAFEQFGGMSLQSSFERLAKRWMRERDYTAWLAVKMIGEAVTRTGSNDIAVLRDYILSDAFKIAGHKGLGMNFRRWDHQLRQPVLVSGPRALVSISPQEGFLHPKFETDTLGFDEPETQCRFD